MGSMLVYSLIKNQAGIVSTELRDQFRKHGYRFFDSGDFNLNIVGIRSPDRRSNKFDDVLCCVYKISGDWRYKAWPITTDPGIAYRTTPYANTKGTAILKAGQYRGAFDIGLHRGQYSALVQRKKVTVYRDNNRDSTLNHVDEEEGYFGINIHRASAHRSLDDVGSYSAGCQVFSSPDDFEEFMKLCQRSATRYGSHFTYTLLE